MTLTELSTLSKDAGPHLRWLIFGLEVVWFGVILRDAWNGHVAYSKVFWLAVGLVLFLLAR